MFSLASNSTEINLKKGIDRSQGVEDHLNFGFQRSARI